MIFHICYQGKPKWNQDGLVLFDVAAGGDSGSNNLLPGAPVRVQQEGTLCRPCAKVSSCFAKDGREKKKKIPPFNKP